MKLLNSIMNFFVPKFGIERPRKYRVKNFYTAILIPTWSPSIETYRLVLSITKWHPNILLIVIDDSTPPENMDVMDRIKRIKNKNLVYLRTPQNKLKAGALNFGLKYLYSLKKQPKIVLTLDDDVQLDKETIPILRNNLYTRKMIGATCTTVQVLNKNRNLLTRLQSLEYHNFNLTKIADNTLFNGPLVMQGLITCFRMSALREVGGFTDRHLIEDYDITAKLKKKGWKVKIAHKALAYTNVPVTLDILWKQRVRWTYGGLHVVSNFWKYVYIIFQDIIGHLMFLSLALLILIPSFFEMTTALDSTLVTVLVIVALIQLTVSTLYNLILLSSYRNSNIWDWIIKLTIIPEFVYSNILSLNLVGSYMFFIYQRTVGSIKTRFKIFNLIFKSGYFLFQKAGYTSSWGTKAVLPKGGVKI